MKRLKRKTLAGPARLEGTGIHTGKKAKMTLEPRREGGLRFMSSGVEIPADGRYLGEGSRGTDLRKDGVDLKTVEHLLAACSGAGVTDLLLEIEGPEVPGLDGSAAEFLRILRKAGIMDLDSEVEPIKLEKPVLLESGGARIEARPADVFTLEYHLSYPQYPVVAEQNFVFREDSDSFERDLAPARTFCLEPEVEALRKAGLALGGSLDTAVVAGPKGYLNPSVRFPDEPCRHKCLDLMGDLVLLGRPILAHIRGDRSGHRLNGLLVKTIQETLGAGVA